MAFHWVEEEANPRVVAAFQIPFQEVEEAVLNLVVIVQKHLVVEGASTFLLAVVKVEPFYCCFLIS